MSKKYSIVDIISDRFNKIISANKINDGNFLIVLKGFSSAMVNAIRNAAEHENFEILLPNISPLNISNITDNARMFLTKLMTQGNNSPIICLYEQYLSVSDILNAGIKLTERTIIILENNLFLSVTPSLLSSDISESLYKYFESDEQGIPQELETYTNFYSDVCILGNNQYGVTYINKHIDEKLDVIPFFEMCDLETQPEVAVGQMIEALTDEFWQYITDLLNGTSLEPVTIVRNEQKIGDRIVASLVNILSKLNVSYGVQKFNSFEELISSTRHFLPLLRKQHGESAEFRKLLFYKCPNISNELIKLSQETIISDIVTQSEKALLGNNDFKNLFITAPTGAGKSLLFQLPAIYLAEQYNAVTIVVSPLIALMKDQVDNLEEHGINCATYLNSTISYEERESRSIQIKNGQKSIVYLAPELLLSCPIHSLLGERKLGLFVVDEAHTITSWGRDFRVDYWFLGDYLKNSRKRGFSFPVLCLTATAVYGGAEDVVNETIATLGLKSTRILLGNIKRDNISFDVRPFNKGENLGSYEQVKLVHTAKAIGEYVDSNQKTLIYCPYATQVSELFRQIDSNYKDHVGIYHGQLNNSQKKIYQDNFRKGKITTMICTKAYGMGIDVQDIVNCYHFAPSGNLSDYVQEIGRIARNKSTQGVARIDFSTSDMRYTRVLHGISGLKQYQLKEIIRKLYDIYSVKNHRNLLIAPDVFGYMFGDQDIENKVKSGLLLLSKDLEEKYGFPVINVRPKTMFTKNYVCVSADIEKEFIQKYHDVVRKLPDYVIKINNTKKSSGSDTIVRNNGSIYEVDMSSIWEREFSELTFADFKRRFFEGTLFSEDGKKKFWPRVRISINYKKPFDEIYNILSFILDKLTEVFTDLKDNCGFFVFSDFKSKITKSLEGSGINIGEEFLRILMEIFVVEVPAGVYAKKHTEKLTFLQKRNGTDFKESTYRVIGNNHLYLKNNMLQLLQQSKPNTGSNCFISYIPAQNNGQRPNVMKLLSILEILDISSFEIRGGTNVEIFVRINDPMKLRYLSQGRYTNNILRDIESKRKSATQTLSNFFQCQLTNEERWDVIENYFLGKEDYVKNALNITEE